MILKRILGVTILLFLGFLVFSLGSIACALIVMFVKVVPLWLLTTGSVLCSMGLVAYWLESYVQDRHLGGEE